MVASSGTLRKSRLRSSSSRIVTIATGVSKNWASCHPMKPVRQPPSKRPPELQNRVQTNEPVRCEQVDNINFVYVLTQTSARRPVRLH